MSSFLIGTLTAVFDSESGDAPPPLRERNRRRVRAELLAATANMLGDTDRGELTLEAVSRQAGVSRGTLYLHFPGGREHLIRESYATTARTVLERGLELRRDAASGAEATVALCQAFVEAAVDPSSRFYVTVPSDVAALVTDAAGTTAAAFEALICEDLLTAEPKFTAEEARDVATILVGAIVAAGAAAAADASRAERMIGSVRFLVTKTMGS